MAKKKKGKGAVVELNGRPRRFVYEDFAWEDPGEEFDDLSVLSQAAAFLPALAGGAATREDKGEYVLVTFAPKPKKLG